MKEIYDIHTHILPRVDDGAASLREAMEILEDQVHQGVVGILLTPHYRLDRFEAAEVDLYTAYKLLVHEAAKHFPRLELRLACEFHAAPRMAELLAGRRFCTLDGDKTLLLEFSAGDSREYIREKTEELLQYGYRPLLAHVERYAELYGQEDLLQDLRHKGVALQINGDSLLGLEDARRRRFCKTLLKYKMVDYIASDVHNMTTRPSHIRQCAELVEKKWGEEYARRLFVTNPGKFFGACQKAPQPVLCMQSCASPSRD